MSGVGFWKELTLLRFKYTKWAMVQCGHCQHVTASLGRL